MKKWSKGKKGIYKNDDERRERKSFEFLKSSLLVVCVCAFFFCFFRTYTSKHFFSFSAFLHIFFLFLCAFPPISFNVRFKETNSSEPCFDNENCFISNMFLNAHFKISHCFVRFCLGFVRLAHGCIVRSRALDALVAICSSNMRMLLSLPRLLCVAHRLFLIELKLHKFVQRVMNKRWSALEWDCIGFCMKFKLNKEKQNTKTNPDTQQRSSMHCVIFKWNWIFRFCKYTNAVALLFQ